MNHPKHPIVAEPGKTVHFRLCHSCLKVTESLRQITQCSHCGRQVSYLQDHLNFDSAQTWEEASQEEYSHEDDNVSATPAWGPKDWAIKGLSVLW